MLKASINGEVLRQNYSVGKEIPVPSDLERYIAEAVWQVGATEENTSHLIREALSAARAVFADHAHRWNLVQQRADAKTAVSRVMNLLKVDTPEMPDASEAGKVA